MNRITCAVCFLALCAILVAPSVIRAEQLDTPPPPRPKAAVPATADLQKAEKEIRDVFKKEYQEKDPAKRRELAEKMLAQGVETPGDPAIRFVLLREAREIAAQALALATAFDAVDKIVELFADVKPVELKAALMALARKNARTAEDALAIAEFDMKLAEYAIGEGDYRTALASAKSAEKTAQSAKNADLAQRAGDLAREIPGIEREGEAARKAEATLAAAPDDPAASLVYGKYLCFVKGEWDRGLPLLAKGSDAGLKDVATQELQKSVVQSGDAEAIGALADKWYELAGKSGNALDKRRFLGRAADLYHSAAASATGFLKSKIDRRLEELKSKSAPSAVSKGRTVDLAGVKMELVLVPAGEFMMGSNDGDGEEKPVHKVRISKPFHLGKYEVTVAQFRAFAQATKYQTEAERAGRGWGVRVSGWEEKAGINWRTPGFKQDDNHPACAISWNDAQEFCQWATKVTGRTVRLPTEAEWEYAARGPKSPKYPWGDKWDGAPANVADKSLRDTGFGMPFGEIRENDGFPYTSPAGTYKTSASWCGAFDMAGNVWEWCEDFFSGSYYGESPPVDPKGPSTGGERVVRGGCWIHGPALSRSARRDRFEPATRYTVNGFRAALDF
jgi:formylglycine-generating enzyme